MERESEDKSIILPEFKYYKGEKVNPFLENDIRRIFWWGEMMFSRLPNIEEQFTEYEEDVIRWRKSLLDYKSEQAARLLNENSNRQLCIALYIALLWGKWRPYDDHERITEY